MATDLILFTIFEELLRDKQVGNIHFGKRTKKIFKKI